MLNRAADVMFQQEETLVLFIDDTHRAICLICAILIPNLNLNIRSN